MSTWRNIHGFILGGFIEFFAYLAGALLLCLTIIGIPLASLHLEKTRLALLPFGYRGVDEH